MSVVLMSLPQNDDSLSTWSQHPDIDKVDGRLSKRDCKFFKAVGERLANSNYTSRFAVTLLHSHFQVNANEALIESHDEHGLIVTSTHNLKDTEENPQVVAKSWMFRNEPSSSDIECLDVLTWINTSDLPQAPLSNSDAYLIGELAQIYRDWGMTARFGMAFVGVLPEKGKIWTEGTCREDRKLIQEQLPVEEVKARDPIMTRITVTRITNNWGQSKFKCLTQRSSQVGRACFLCPTFRWLNMGIIIDLPTAVLLLNV